MLVVYGCTYSFILHKLLKKNMVLGHRLRRIRSVKMTLHWSKDRVSGLAGPLPLWTSEVALEDPYKVPHKDPHEVPLIFPTDLPDPYLNPI